MRQRTRLDSLYPEAYIRSNQNIGCGEEVKEEEPTEIQRNDNFRRAMSITFFRAVFRTSLAPYSWIETTADEC